MPRGVEEPTECTVTRKLGPYAVRYLERHGSGTIETDAMASEAQRHATRHNAALS